MVNDSASLHRLIKTNCILLNQISSAQTLIRSKVIQTSSHPQNSTFHLLGLQGLQKTTEVVQILLTKIVQKKYLLHVFGGLCT
jgi:hypothetical protein